MPSSGPTWFGLVWFVCVETKTSLHSKTDAIAVNDILENHGRTVLISKDNNDFHDILGTLGSIDCKDFYDINGSLETLDQTFRDQTRPS